ncbi:MAG: hypothetical protein A4S09_01610 [Proteobacteria bacterium SG_bin7]|nr:MAG: hypothetical protein A4S09_01610 [Proteobacteria bacterium SG_bin7]
MKIATTLFTMLTFIVTFQINLAEANNPHLHQRPAFSWEGTDLNSEKCNVLVDEIVDNESSQVLGLKGVYTDNAGSKTFTISLQDSSYRSEYKLDPYSSPAPRAPHNLKGRMDGNKNQQIILSDLVSPVAEVVAHDAVVIKKCNHINTEAN